MVTAYDASSAALADAAGLDIVLVGDSAAMTILGHESTLPVTMDEMLLLTRAVTRGVRERLSLRTCRSALTISARTRRCGMPFALSKMPVRTR